MRKKLKVIPSNAGDLIEVKDIDEAAGTKSSKLFLGFLENSLQGFRASCPIRKQPCRHSIPIEPIRHQCTPDKGGGEVCRGLLGPQRKMKETMTDSRD